MSRQAQSSATSAHALQTAAPTPPRLTADSLGASGSNDALAKLNAAISELKAMSAGPMLQRALEAIRAEDAKAGCEWALKALEQDERSGFGWYLLGIALERAGDFPSSIQAYEAALKLLPDHAEVANDLGRLAFRLGMTQQAESLFRHFLARFPDHPEGSNNLACAIRDQGRHGEAVEILRPAIVKTPDVAMLWNTMGTVVSDQGDFANAVVFFEEALRLDPTFPKARYNLGNAKLLQGDATGAIADCEAALGCVLAEDERQMMRLARSTILMALGRVGEGWDDYEARLHPQFNERTQFLFDEPRWEPGCELTGKTLLVVGEQGLGDEVLFANVLPDVIERLGSAGRLILAVEPRLVPIFRRAFPSAEVVEHATYILGGKFARGAPRLENEKGVDLWTPMGSLLREFRRSGGRLSGPRRLHDRPIRPAVAHWREALRQAPAGPKVGLLWKSAVSKDARHRYFSPFETWAPVLAQKGVSFVNLQYGDCTEELAAASRDFGVDIWSPPGVDLKQDLDDVAALCSAMDLVVGFSNATLNIAAACGVPNLLISTPCAWPRLGTATYPWYPKTRVFLPPSFGEWEPVMAEVADALGAFAAERAKPRR